MNLYTFRYKEKLLKQDLIEASSQEKAYQMGREYCKEGSGRMFISVTDAILLHEKVVPTGITVTAEMEKAMKVVK